MKSRIVACPLALVSTCLLSIAAWPRPAMATSFTITTLPSVPGSSETDFDGISNTGQFVGFYFDTTGEHGFVDTSGTFTAVNVPFTGVTGTNVHGINNAGDLVGTYATTTCGVNNPATSCAGAQGYRDIGGGFTSTDFPGAKSSDASGINNLDQIVGTFTDGSGKLGAVTGDQGFLYSGGVFTAINDPLAAGGAATALNGINDAGQAVGGYKDVSGAVHGFIYSSTLMTFLSVDVPGALQTIVGGINNAGQVDGVYVDTTNTPHAFFYDGTSFTTLVLPGAFSTLGGINDAGQIDGSYVDAGGTLHGFLATPTAATPVPEPASLTLTALGLAGVVSRYRRRRASR